MKRDIGKNYLSNLKDAITCIEIEIVVRDNHSYPAHMNIFFEQFFLTIVIIRFAVEGIL